MSIITSYLTGQRTKKLSNDLVVQENTLNFAAGETVAVADVVQALDIPDNSVVLRVHWAILTADAAAADVDVGFDLDPNGLDDAINISATALDAANATGVGGSLYGTDVVPFFLTGGDNTIDLTFNTNGPSTGKLYISAHYYSSAVDFI